MDSQQQYNLNELMQFMDHYHDNNYLLLHPGINEENSLSNHLYPSTQDIGTSNQQNKFSKQVVELQNNHAVSVFPFHPNTKLQLLNRRSQETQEIQTESNSSKTMEDMNPLIFSELKDTLNYDELFDAFINSEIDAQPLKESSGSLKLTSPYSVSQDITSMTTPLDYMNRSGSKSYIFEDQENIKYGHYLIHSAETDVGRIYRYPNNSGRKFDIGALKLVSNGYKRARVISASVNKTIDDEFEFKSRFYDFRKRQTTELETPNAKIRKRNNHTTDEVEWKPLSIFTVYTNFKPESIDDTDYFENIPMSSCFGRLNMRVKRAWTRGPNKVKLK